MTIGLASAGTMTVVAIGAMSVGESAATIVVTSGRVGLAVMTATVVSVRAVSAGTVTIGLASAGTMTVV
ncbi:hypothetical protein, partial [Streptomyces javensis]